MELWVWSLVMKSPMDLTIKVTIIIALETKQEQFELCTKVEMNMSSENRKSHMDHKRFFFETVFIKL